MSNKEIFKEFLRNNQYHVMHETDNENPKLEHFFVFFQINEIMNMSTTKKRDLKDVEIILTYLNDLQNVSLMQNLSEPTFKFIQKQKNKIIYIPLESLDNSHFFYLKRKKILEDNYENLISLKILSEPADAHKHFHYKMDSKVSEIKDIGIGIFGFAKDKLKEKKPLLRGKLYSLQSRLKSFKK